MLNPRFSRCQLFSCKPLQVCIAWRPSRPYTEGMNNTLSINHICAPRLPVPRLLELCAQTGFGGVELRNDLGTTDPLAGVPLSHVVDTAARLNVRIISINALQRCNDASIADQLVGQLRHLASLARDLGGAAVVMCPVNDHADARTPAQRIDETAANLSLFDPVFAEFGVLGLLEPLGFPQSSLRSLQDAGKAIAQAGASHCRVLLDTFHYALGPDTIEELSSIDPSTIGLVHVSGVTDPRPFEQLTDAERILLTPADRLQNAEQLAVLARTGYRGTISFEPFSPEVQALSDTALERALLQSAALVGAATAV